jgi:hypothetical protein
MKDLTLQTTSVENTTENTAENTAEDMALQNVLDIDHPSLADSPGLVNETFASEWWRVGDFLHEPWLALLALLALLFLLGVMAWTLRVRWCSKRGAAGTKCCQWLFWQARVKALRQQGLRNEADLSALLWSLYGVAKQVDEANEASALGAELKTLVQAKAFSAEEVSRETFLDLCAQLQAFIRRQRLCQRLKFWRLAEFKRSPSAQNMAQKDIA